MTRLVGVQIAGGFTAEARAFAALLGHAPMAAPGKQGLTARVFCQSQGSASRNGVVAAAMVAARHNGASKLLSAPGGAAVEWGTGAEDPAQHFAETVGNRVGTAVISMDFGWRATTGQRAPSDRVRARLQFLAALPRALVIAREGAPDVVYSSHHVWDSYAGTYLARRLRLPLVIHVHSAVGPRLQRPILARLRRCAHVITSSDWVRSGVIAEAGVAPHRITTLRTPVALPEPTVGVERDAVRRAVRRELGIPESVPLVGMVGRLEPEKGQADAIEAFAGARAFAGVRGTRASDAHLLIVGGEAAAHRGFGDALQQRAERLGVGTRVRQLGWRKDVPRLLEAMDVFLHPSRHEPFGLSIAEASAAALPVVGYAEGGVPEIVEHEVTGLLAPAGETARAAEYLGGLLADPNRATRMGDAGRARIERLCSPDIAGEAFAALLQSAPWAGPVNP